MRITDTPIPEWRNVDHDLFEREIVPRFAPAVLRGLVRDWPAVRAGAASSQTACAYLRRFDQGAPVEAFLGAPGIGGRFFYRDDMAGFNFEKRRLRFGDVLTFLAEEDAPGRPAVYVGATPVAQCAPGFEVENALSLIADKPAVPRLWIGNATVVAAHFDMSDNIACLVSGRRRFTVFPPEEVANLYVGPLDHNMAGQPASMVSFAEPDLDRFPRFRQAMAAAQVAELGPGDAIYIPSPWWHHVEALDPFNVLLNYWWDDQPADAGSPLEALGYGILAVSNLPEGRREAWRSLFDHYVFKRDGEPAAHLAPGHRGILGPSTPQLRARIRQFLMQGLARR